MKRTKRAKKAAASKLKSRRVLRRKRASRKKAAKARKKASPASSKAKIVRIMGRGQYAVDTRTLKKLNEIDNSIVELVRQERSDDIEFKKKLTELNKLVVRAGRALSLKEIVQSDIILPSADLSIDEAKRLFRGEGVIPEI